MKRSLVALAGGALIIALTTPPAGAAPTVAAPVTVDVPVRLVQAPITKALYGMTTVRIGNSKPIRVTVDTGSVGLRLLPGAWKTVPSGVTMTDRRITWAADGERLQGRIGSGLFGISGLRGDYPISFMFMDKSSWTEQAAAQGIQGVLGIGLSRQDLPNPLTTLPGNVGRQWTVRFTPNTARTGGTGALVLGADVPAQSFTTFDLRTQGQDPQGVPLWDDQAADACWVIGALSEICGDTYFDSMAPFMLIKGSDFAPLRTTTGGFLASGISISMGAPHTSFYAWNFTSGQRFGLNRAKVSATGRTLINTSSAIYSAFTVAYDVTEGVITLSD
ncbi:MAG: hypothetical protein ACKOJC_08405 [Actinomycetota bacterium]